MGFLPTLSRASPMPPELPAWEFSRKIRQGDRYRLRAGLRCLPETHEIEFGERDPLVRWFELHAHLI